MQEQEVVDYHQHFETSRSSSSGEGHQRDRRAGKKHDAWLTSSSQDHATAKRSGPRALVLSSSSSLDHGRQASQCEDGGGASRRSGQRLTLSDMFQNVTRETRDIFRQYSCMNGGGAFGSAYKRSNSEPIKFSSFLLSAKVKHDRIANHSPAEEEGCYGMEGECIEFDEEEILRRDYELNRV